VLWIQAGQQGDSGSPAVKWVASARTVGNVSSGARWFDNLNRDCFLRISDHKKGGHFKCVC
ncbi:uncharacterized protein METZ01_LOCUS25271, partial [marine metagenome]